MFYCPRWLILYKSSSVLYTMDSPNSHHLRFGLVWPLAHQPAHQEMGLALSRKDWGSWGSVGSDLASVSESYILFLLFGGSVTNKLCVQRLADGEAWRMKACFPFKQKLRPKAATGSWLTREGLRKRSRSTGWNGVLGFYFRGWGC